MEQILEGVFQVVGVLLFCMAISLLLYQNSIVSDLQTELRARSQEEMLVIQNSSESRTKREQVCSLLMNELDYKVVADGKQYSGKIEDYQSFDLKAGTYHKEYHFDSFGKLITISYHSGKEG